MAVFRKLGYNAVSGCLQRNATQARHIKHC